MIFLLLMSITIIMSQQEYREQRELLAGHVGTDQIHTARRLELIISSALSPFEALSRRSHPDRLPTEREYSEALTQLTDRGLDYDLLAYADAQAVCRFVWPSEYAELIGTDLSRHEMFGRLYEYARSRPRHASSMIDRSNTDRLRFMISMPVGAQEDGIADGVIIGFASIDPILRDLVGAPMSGSYAMELSDDDGTFFTLSQSPSRRMADPEPLHVLDQRWLLSLMPTDQYVTEGFGREPLWVFAGGLAISLLLSGGVLQMMHHRWRDAELTRRHVLALESVNRIAAAIGGQPGTRQELLDRLALEPRRLLGVSRSFIALHEEAFDQVRIISASSEDPLSPEFPNTYTASEPESIRMAVHDRRIVISNDVELDANIFHIDILRKLKVRSLMMIPLIGRDRVIGLWTITCDRPHGFHEAEVHLAALWASQIALTLINGHYFDEMNQALEAQKKLSAQLDTMATVNAAIFQATSVEESLQKIADLAPQALNVDMCVASLLTSPGELTVVTATGAYAAPIIGVKFAVKGNNAEIVLRTRQMLVIEDSTNDPTLNQYYRDILKIRSIVYLPMFNGDGSAIGVIGLARHIPTIYDPEQLRLIEIFGRRAAAALENAILHQRARRNAETRIMLLRELNHRVKNNLAGIVSLLTIGQEELPGKARQWLDRVVERISMMARAHELFSSGVEKVALNQLVAQLLSSLSVVRSADVEIRTEVSEVNAFLRTDRAVSLAMVLHELCHNAIVHGVRGGGTVSVIAHRTCDDGVLVIDVINDAPASIAPGDGESMRSGDASTVAVINQRVAEFQKTGSATDGGIGLKLVSGLVRRELHGIFSIASRPQIGTIARVKFPLLPDELLEEVTL